MKRGRDGNVLLQSPPGCVFQRPVESYPVNIKRRRSLAAEDMEQRLGPNKRPATFDLELERMHKRLRATVPTAEQAIAHLIPHVNSLRNLYCESQDENKRLKKHLVLLNAAYQASLGQNASLNRQLDASRAEVAALRRQVDMMKYRVALTECNTKRSLNP